MNPKVLALLTAYAAAFVDPMLDAAALTATKRANDAPRVPVETLPPGTREAARRARQMARAAEKRARTSKV